MYILGHMIVLICISCLYAQPLDGGDVDTHLEIVLVLVLALVFLEIVITEQRLDISVNRPCCQRIHAVALDSGSVAVKILRTKGEMLVLPFSTGTGTDTHMLFVQLAIASLIVSGRKRQLLQGMNFQQSCKILAVVVILGVDAITIEDTDLIRQIIKAPVSRGKEITIEHGAYIAAVGFDATDVVVTVES